MTKLVTWSNRYEDCKNANSLFQRRFLRRGRPRILRSLFARKGWKFITSHLRFTLASIKNRAKNEAPEEEAGTRQGRNENIYVSNAWFNWTCYDPPGQPRGQILPLGQGEAELFEMALSRVVGGGANKK